MAQRGRRVLRKADPAPPQTRRVRLDRGTPSRDKPLLAGNQRCPKTLHLDRRPRQNHRRRATRAPNVRFDPLAAFFLGARSSLSGQDTEIIALMGAGLTPLSRQDNPPPALWRPAVPRGSWVRCQRLANKAVILTRRAECCRAYWATAFWPVIAKMPSAHRHRRTQRGLLQCRSGRSAG